MYVGTVPKNSSIVFSFLTVNTSGVPTNVSSATIDYAVYNSSFTSVATGTVSTTVIDSNTGFYSLSQITSAAAFVAASAYLIVVTFQVGGADRRLVFRFDVI